MTANVGTLDRILRAALGIALIAIAFAVLGGGALRWIAAIVGVVMLATSAMRFCPLYTLFGIRTCKA